MIYKNLTKKIVYNRENNKCIMHRCESCPGNITLKEFLDQEHNKYKDDEKFNYCQWDTTDRAILANFTATYKEYKEYLIYVIDDLTRHSYTQSLKLPVLNKRRNPKLLELTGVKNSASYIPWLYTTWDQMVASNMYFSSDDNNHYRSFFSTGRSCICQTSAIINF